MRCISAVISFFLISILSGQIDFAESAFEKRLNHNCGGWMVGAGISTTDFNNDGLDDLTLARVEGEHISFYINEGDRFRKIEPLVDNRDEIKQILWVDFDNDGDKDLYISIYGGYNRLYENIGNLELVDITLKSGLPSDVHKGYGAIFGDYNRDGWLDLYYSSRDYDNIFSADNINRFFQNNADGTFSDITEESGASDLGKIPFCSIFFDYNNDDWPDIFTANDKLARNSLFENNKGKFFNISQEAKVDYRMNAMCSMAGDVNKDGFFDLYITNTPIGNKFLINSSDEDGYRIYADQTLDYGVLFEGNGWASNFFDADNDGDLDLYVSGSWVGSDRVSSIFYEYLNESFVIPDVSEFYGDTVSSFTNAIGDFNDDGLLDIVVHNNEPYPFHLWENNSANSNNWIKFELEGVLSNRDGIGSRIEYFSDGDQQIRYTHCGSGFLGQNSSVIHFGTKSNKSVDLLRIKWASGHIDEFLNLDTNNKYYLKEGQSTNGIITVANDVNIIPRSLSTSVLEEYQSDDIQIYPNPVKETLTLESKIELINIEIINSEGKLIKSISENSRFLDVSQLNSGHYVLKATTNKGYVIKQWIKQWIKQ